MTFLSSKRAALLTAVLALWGAILPLRAAAQEAVDAPPHPEARPYLGVFLASAMSVQGHGPDVAMGGPVVLHGSSSYGHGQASGLLLGREFVREREQQEPRHTRLELELWRGSVQQRSLRIGSADLTLQDKLPASALLINGLWRMGTTEHSRWWLGAGIGQGRVSHPDRQGAVPGCACLGPETARGLAWRLKLQGERQLSEQTALFLHAGYLHLPGAATAGLPSTRYGALGLTDLAIGVRQRF